MKIFICDDDEKVLETLAIRVEEKSREFDTNAQIECFSTCTELLAEVNNIMGKIDILFIDIVFNEADGIGAANEIHYKYPNIKIIFITGYIKYAPDIFDAAPIYMLKKPIQNEKLTAAIKLAYSLIEKEETEHFTVRIGNCLQKITYAKIEYFESDKRKVSVFGSLEEQISFYGKLKEIEQNLPDNFISCHQSYIVNIKKVKAYNKDEITMFSGRVIPVSQRKRLSFREALINYSVSDNSIL